MFCMRYIRGFDNQIVEALKSRNSDIHLEAVRAAGDREVDAAWPHVAALIANKTTDKPLLLAAIGAAASIRPREARSVIGPLLDSEDEEIEEVASEALAMAESSFGEDDDEGDWDEGVGPQPS